MSKLIWAYIVNNYKKSLALVVVLSVSICVIFSNSTAKKSQLEYIKRVMAENRPKAEVVYSDISKSQFDKIKDSENIKSYTKVSYYGKVSYLDRFTRGLIGYDKNYFKNFKLSLKSGRLPENDKEILVYESLTKSDNLKIGQNINLKGYKKYYDSNKRISVENYGISPKIVGVYTCPDVMKSFYLNDDIMIGPSFEKVVNKSYNGTIDFKDGVDVYGASLDITSMMDSNSDHVYIDGIVSRMQEEDVSLMREKDSLDWSFIVLSIFMTFNIICLMANQISRDQGLLRVIGMSRKGVLLFEFLRNAVLFVVSTLLGVVLSIPLSEFFARTFIYSSLDVNMSKAPLVYDWTCMKNVLVILFFVVLISVLVPSIKVFFRSPIEQYKCINRRKMGSRFNLLVNKLFKGIDARIVVRAVVNQKVFVLVSAVIVGYSGYLYAKEYTMPESWDSYSAPLIRSFRDYDIRLSQNGRIDGLIGGYSMDDVDKIRAIDNMGVVYPKAHSFGYMYISPKELTKQYKAQRLIKDTNKEAEIRFDILGMPREMLVDFVDRDKILKSGRLPSGKIENDVVEILIYNNFYLKMEERGVFDIIKGINIGDTIEVILETYDKGNLGYKKQKMKVVGIIDQVWGSFLDTESFVPDVIMDPVIYKKVTGSDRFSNIEIKLKDGADGPSVNWAYNRVDSLFKDRAYTQIDTLSMKHDDMNRYAKIFRKKEMATSVVLFVLAITNVVVGIILSFEVRKKEFGGLLSIGMPKIRLKRINTLNAIVVVIPGLFGMIAIVVKDSIEIFEWVKMCAREQFIPFKETIHIPWIQMGIFSLVCIVCMVMASIYLNRKIDETNIIDMVREED